MLKRKEEAAAARRASLDEGRITEAEAVAAEAKAEAEGDDDDGGSPFAPPDEAKDYPLWLLSLPWYAVFTITIPPWQGRLVQSHSFIPPSRPITFVHSLDY